MLLAIILFYLVAVTCIMLLQFYCYKRYCGILQSPCQFDHHSASTTPHMA